MKKASDRKSVAASQASLHVEMNARSTLGTAVRESARQPFSYGVTDAAKIEDATGMHHVRWTALELRVTYSLAL